MALGSVFNLNSGAHQSSVTWLGDKIIYLLGLFTYLSIQQILLGPTLIGRNKILSQDLALLL
jgi:hypothetical protein